jgi:hypothetical protein
LRMPWCHFRIGRIDGNRHAPRVLSLVHASKR